MPKCTRCQKTVVPDAERCPNCGAWLSQLDDAPEPIQDSLAGGIRSLLNQGQKIAAIKLFREHTGVGLAEAKAAVERIEQGKSFPEPDTDSLVVDDDLEKSILDLMAAGQKIAAIKLYREQTRSGLKDAKDAVEALAAQHGIVSSSGSNSAGVTILVFAILVPALIAWLIWAWK